MPLYEYYCEPCNGVFELLRTTRQAQAPQSCPECDGDAPRIMSKDFSAFTVRGGAPRRLPDDGSHWHLGQKVSKPVDRAVRSNSHPELERNRHSEGPSLEEIEEIVELRSMTASRERGGGAIATSKTEQQRSARLRQGLRGNSREQDLASKGGRQEAAFSVERVRNRIKQIPTRKDRAAARAKRQNDLE